MKTKITYLIAFIIALIFSACSSKNVTEKIIGLKQNIHHDDFEYSVEDFYKTDTIGGQRANGTFYVVTFQVENKARRVNHEWDNNIAYMTDENSKQYSNLNEKQKALNSIKPFKLKDKYVTPPGTTDLTVLVFDIPKEVKQPCLKVSGEFLMGDMFDGSQFANTKIKLF